MGWMKEMKKLMAFMMTSILMLVAITGCGGEKTPVEALGEVTQIPEEGIITKEQFATVAGEDKQITFTGTGANDIQYSWTFSANLIKNPQDQNLKINFTTDVLDTVKAKGAEAVHALGVAMEGTGLIAAATLDVTVPELWNVKEASLVKEENGTLEEITPVAITRNEGAGTTTLTMNLATMEKECFILGIGAEDVVSTDTAEEVTTAAAEETTTETTQETTTSKKEETTTAKKEETTTSKKEETTTAKKEETTTAKKEETTTEDTKLTCTISISCATILNNMDKLDPAKKDFVPSDGWILKKTTVTFEKGESVHEILKRVCREKGIHMESTYTPVYDSAYVEGINQLYEFDCGSESGWMYKVNGWFPNYGSSQYEVSNGDNIAWVYTCDLGDDVGDNSMQ